MNGFSFLDDEQIPFSHQEYGISSSSSYFSSCSSPNSNLGGEYGSDLDASQLFPEVQIDAGIPLLFGSSASESTSCGSIGSASFSNPTSSASFPQSYYMTVCPEQPTPATTTESFSVDSFGSNLQFVKSSEQMTEGLTVSSNAYNNTTAPKPSATQQQPVQPQGSPKKPANASKKEVVNRPMYQGRGRPSFKAKLAATGQLPPPKASKKKSSASEEKEKYFRPKISTSATQCLGRNRKKGTQCRNAALMEYLGPKPKYCAEHIHLDDECLHAKCLGSISKEMNLEDRKGCKEVVLKEFKYCHKHIPEYIDQLLQEGQAEFVKHLQTRCLKWTAQLEQETSAAKKNNLDLYQRKNKILPKYHDMRLIFNRVCENLH